MGMGANLDFAAYAEGEGETTTVNEAAEETVTNNENCNTETEEA